jgi:hypothetical protein
LETRVTATETRTRTVVTITPSTNPTTVITIQTSIIAIQSSPATTQIESSPLLSTTRGTNLPPCASHHSRCELTLRKSSGFHRSHHHIKCTANPGVQ